MYIGIKFFCVLRYVMYEMSCMQCWLLSNSMNSVMYQDSSSFQVFIEFFHFQLMCMRKTSELKSLC